MSSKAPKAAVGTMQRLKRKAKTKRPPNTPQGKRPKPYRGQGKP